VDVYVINLDRQTERMRWMKRGLDAAGIPFHRVRAFDAARLSPAFIERRTAPHPHKLTRFDIAAIVSHRKAWRALLRSSAPHCVVLEDDVHLGRDFGALLAALDAGAAVFDVIKLESVGERVLIDSGSAYQVAGRRLCPLRSAFMGAAGYIVNRKAAATLLRVTRNMAVPIDWFLFADSYLVANRLVVLQTVPGIVAQEEFLRRGATDLRSRRPPRTEGVDRLRKPALALKILHEIVRPFRQFAAARVRQRMRRGEPGLRWGRIGFE
jgi:glycosyl transferase family 25